VSLERKRTDSRGTEDVLRELQRNFALRRLLLVALNVLVPAFILTGVKLSTMNQAVSGLEILWSHSLVLGAVGVTICAFSVAVSMTRCQYGIVVNAALINWRVYGRRPEERLNWYGISSGFFILAVLSVATGFAILVFCLVSVYFPLEGAPLLCFSFLATVVVLLFAGVKFHATHTLAWRTACKLITSEAETSSIDALLRQEHRMNSLDDTNSDIGVVLVTAIALFSTMLTAIPDIAAVSNRYVGEQVVYFTVNYGFDLTAVYAILVLLVSQSMLLRLRVATAEHASLLEDQSGTVVRRIWASKFWERSSVFYLFLAVLCALYITMLGVRWFDNNAIALFIGCLYVLFSRLWYVVTMRQEYRNFKQYWSDSL